MRLLDPAYVEGVFAAARNLSPREVEALEQMGIPADTLAGPTPVRVSCGHFEGEGFAFDHHGPPREDPTHVYIFLITNPWHEAIDIVACSPSLNKSAAWLGRAWALGEESIYRARLADHGALPVHRSPVGWLKARREGICIVRPQAAAHWLCDAGPLLAEDDEHGVELKQLLTRHAPRILVHVSNLKKAS